MTATQAQIKPQRQIGDVSTDAGRAPTQIGWYRFAAQTIAHGRTVLDVGCGLGHGLAELRTTAATAMGQDLDPRLECNGIIIGDIDSIPDKSFDVVISIDVVEHVSEDAAFVRHLARVARYALFLTTPLSSYGRAIWPYHVREYRAKEFVNLMTPLGQLTYFIGSPSGTEIFRVRSMEYFWALDYLINSRIFNAPFRAAQKMLPHRLRYNAHQAVLIQLH
jgi:SAM-dependent methyltransferase